MITYQNPVVPGCYPDPSICRVGEDFYLVCSTFEFHPGVPVLHSRDLVHWQTIGHCISRPGQLHLASGEQSHSGIYAPTIRYHGGVFYMITTNVGPGPENGNFFVSAKDPAGPWSDPVFLPTPGIDPSLFFDEDGASWYVGTCDGGIYVQRIDLAEGKMVGDMHILWKGTGGCYPEGPHLYRKDGWYYLLISEGGTERCHMLTMARSRSLTEGYEPCPRNPVMTNRSLGLPIQSVGHADLVEDQHGSWWAVCLGTRTFSYPPRHNLGRETMLVPVDFSGDWPVFGDEGRVLDRFTVNRLPGVPEDASGVLNGAAPAIDCYETDFPGDELDLSWNCIYHPVPQLWTVKDHALILHGNGGRLADADKIAWVGRRQQHHDSVSEVTLTFPCTREGEEAGLTAFCNNRHHYDAALMVIGGQRQLIFRRQIGSLWKIERQLPFAGDTVTLRLTTDRERYAFSFLTEDGWQPLGEGETIYLTTEVGGAFTGNYIGLYSAGNGQPCEAEARFTAFACRKDERA